MRRLRFVVEVEVVEQPVNPGAFDPRPVVHVVAFVRSDRHGDVLGVQRDAAPFDLGHGGPPVAHVVERAMREAVMQADRGLSREVRHG